LNLEVAIPVNPTEGTDVMTTAVPLNSTKMPSQGKRFGDSTFVSKELNKLFECISRS